jgi:hyperosmotically inducible periplasmic protein
MFGRAVTSYGENIMKISKWLCLPLALSAFTLQAADSTEQVDASNIDEGDRVANHAGPQTHTNDSGVGTLDGDDQVFAAGDQPRAHNSAINMRDRDDQVVTTNDLPHADNSGIDALDRDDQMVTTDDQPRANNSGINARDRDDQMLTADDQSQSKVDVALAARIRRAVMAHDGLSIDGQNIKIIASENGVTLRGPVMDAAERAAIETTVRNAAGTATVDSQLELR